MKKMILMLVFGLAVFGYADDLIDLKTKYETAVKKAVEPLNKVYEGELQKLLENYSKSGDLAKVEMIAETIKSIKSTNIETSAKNHVKNDINERLFVGRSWYSTAGVEYHFDKNGAGYRKYQNKKVSFIWFKEPKYIRATLGNGESDYYFSFVSRENAFFGRSSDNIVDEMTNRD
jgi:hypothetical protein